MACLAKEEGITQYPLFVDYGQLCRNREWKACLLVHRRLQLPTPLRMNLRGFGQLISCGLTDPQRRVNEDAFLPGRNLLLLLAGAAYAYQVNANAVAIGLLSEEHRIFPDQSEQFLKKTEDLLIEALGQRIRVIAPLMGFTKRDVLEMCKKRGIQGTYSCHSGGSQPCGRCVSCLELLNAREQVR